MTATWVASTRAARPAAALPVNARSWSRSRPTWKVIRGWASPNPWMPSAARPWTTARRLTKDAEDYSDGLGAFRPCIDLGHTRSVIDGHVSETGTEIPGARWVNVVLGNLKRSLDGSLHAFKYVKFTRRYLADAT